MILLIVGWYAYWNIELRLREILLEEAGYCGQYNSNNRNMIEVEVFKLLSSSLRDFDRGECCINSFRIFWVEHYPGAERVKIFKKILYIFCHSKIWRDMFTFVLLIFIVIRFKIWDSHSKDYYFTYILLIKVFFGYFFL